MEAMDSSGVLPHPEPPRSPLTSGCDIMVLEEYLGLLKLGDLARPPGSTSPFLSVKGGDGASRGPSRPKDAAPALPGTTSWVQKKFVAN
ncbi:hypothetical protein P7K49_020221 [Saguinus oedipus]|uniref:Uncharacterized protein n=1 Tax=Saguinus oedipus TaxID=9490 RepID=A0ABQ9UZL9_SAGOE|nr:hypothetical protein P7K49_020221 [Saguinus oedipus]